MNLEPTAFIFTVLLRAAEAAAAALPGLVVGLIVAGLLATPAGRLAVDRWLAGRSIAACVRAVLLGVLLPAGPVGVLPVLSVLHRRGVAVGTLLCLAVATPAVGLVAWALLLDKQGPGLTLALLGAVLAPTLLAGVLTNRWLEPTKAVAAEAGPGPGILGVLAEAGRHVPAAALYLLLAAACAGVAAGLLPAGTYAHAVMEREPAHAAMALAVLPPAVLTADTAAMLAEQAISSGTLWQVAPGMLLLGAGLSAGLVAWLVRHRPAALAGLALLLVAGLASAAAFDAAFRDRTFTPLEDSHAFDALNHPWGLAGTTAAEAAAQVGPRLARLLSVPTLAAAGAVGLLAVVPLVHRGTRAAEGQRPPTLRPAVATVGAAAVVSCVAGLYSYFPPPDILLDELAFRQTQLDAAWQARHKAPDSPAAQANQQLHRIQRLANRLPAAARLHGRGFDPSALQDLQHVVSRLETLALQHQDAQPDAPDAWRTTTTQLYAAINRLRISSNTPPRGDAYAPVRKCITSPSCTT